VRRALSLAAGLLFAAGAQAADGWSGLWHTPDQRGEQLMRQGDAAAAAQTYSDPRRKAYAELQAGDYAAAAKGFDGFDDSDAQYNRGNALAHAGDLQQALKAYDAALTRNPDNRDAKHNRDLVEQALKQQQSKQQQSPNQQQKDQQQKDQQQKDQQQQSQGGDQSQSGKDGKQDQPGQDRKDQQGSKISSRRIRATASRASRIHPRNSSRIRPGRARSRIRTKPRKRSRRDAMRPAASIASRSSSHRSSPPARPRSSRPATAHAAASSVTIRWRPNPPPSSSWRRSNGCGASRTIRAACCGASS